MFNQELAGENLRIGNFTETFLPQRNGVVTSLLSFGPELVRRGHTVLIFCPKSNVQKHLGMTIQSYPSIVFRPYPEFKIAAPFFGEIPDLDIVHTHGPFSLGLLGLRVAKKQGIPKVSTFHTLLPEYVSYLTNTGKGYLEKIAWNYIRLYYNRFDAIITPSDTMRRVLKYYRVKKPVKVIPNGIDIEFFKPFEKGKARKKLDLEEGEKIFLYLGRLGHEKNVDIVIKAFTKVDAKLIIAGTGPAKDDLRKLVKDLNLGDRITFAGFVHEKLKPLYYSAADALVTASTSETQGIVILEAFACGCPTIGANSLAIAEIVKDGENGYLFKPGNVEHLSQLLQSYEPTKKMRKNALRTAKLYSNKKCADKLTDLYSSLMDRYKPS